MGWGARQWLRLTKETTYGSYDSGGTTVWIRLTGDNAFTPYIAVGRNPIRDAAGGNRRVQVVSSTHAVAGAIINTVLLLVIFFLLDSFWYRREGVLPVDPTPDTARLGFDGGFNFAPGSQLCCFYRLLFRPICPKRFGVFKCFIKFLFCF